MNGKGRRDKGQRAEREVIALLQPVVNKVCEEIGKEAPTLKRNLLQVREGGCDLSGLEWLALEVKFQENFNMGSWWTQTKKSAGPGLEPVLLHRAKHMPWRVRMFGYLPVGSKRVRCPVDISIGAFLVYFEARVREEMTK